MHVWGCTEGLANKGGLLGSGGVRAARHCLLRLREQRISSLTSRFVLRLNGQSRGGSEGDDSVEHTQPRAGILLLSLWTFLTCIASPLLSQHLSTSSASFPFACASKPAITPVRVIIFIQVITPDPTNGTALKPKRFRQRDFSFTPMCCCQGHTWARL